MPTITKIAQQKRKKDRYSIYLDDKYAFSVEEDVLVRNQLTKGTSLTAEEIETINEKDEYHRAYLQAINYLSYRMRSIKEMEQYLNKKEVYPGWIEQIIVKLIDEKLLDDRQFAESYVRDRMHQTSKGPQLIERELGEKGIPKTIAKAATALYDRESQEEKASKWLEKEMRKKTGHSFRRRKEQLRMKLMQRGFDATITNNVMQNSELEQDQDREAEAFRKQADKIYRRHERKHTGFDLQMKVKASLFQKGFQAEMIDEYIRKMDNES